MEFDELLYVQLTNDSKDTFNNTYSEVGLIKALLFDAIDILQGNFHIHLKKVMKKPALLKKHSEMLLQETKDWILDDKENQYPRFMITFREACDYLHLKPSFVRQILRSKNLL